MLELILASGLIAGKMLAEATITDAVSEAIRNKVASAWGTDRVVNHDLQKALHKSLQKAFTNIKTGLQGKSAFKLQEKETQKFIEDFEEKYLTDEVWQNRDFRKEAAKWCEDIA